MAHISEERPMTDQDPLLNTVDAALYVGCTVDYLARLRMRRQGPAFFKHGSLVRYRRSAIDAWVGENTHSPAQAAR